MMYRSSANHFNTKNGILKNVANKKGTVSCTSSVKMNQERLAELIRNRKSK